MCKILLFRHIICKCWHLECLNIFEKENSNAIYMNSSLKRKRLEVVEVILLDLCNKQKNNARTPCLIFAEGYVYTALRSEFHECKVYKNTQD